MQTNLADFIRNTPDGDEADAILRKCVHCGFCTATCPTYLLLGDELDSPRGRIYQIKDMLEGGKPASAEVVKHVDRCLSCLSCMSTCPSGVHYMHLVDHARSHIEDTYRRPFHDRLIRSLLAHILPYPNRFRLAMLTALFGRPLKPLVAALPGIGPRLAAMLDLAPREAPNRSIGDRPGTFPAEGARRGRVALLRGCAQSVLAPGYNEAAIRLLTRQGVEVVQAGEGCCGSLVHHMGREDQSKTFARRAIDAWLAEDARAPLEAILVTASGCGTTIKDYGFMFRDEPAYAQKAAKVSSLARDVTEYVLGLDLPPPVRRSDLVVAYHSACSMQHGQQLKTEPKAVLKRAGFLVKDVPEGHICCGSAGTYNILQPEIASRLRDRKIAYIESVRPDVIAAGNIGCITQIGGGTAIPIVHTVELLDWAMGGPLPPALESLPEAAARPLAAAE